MNRRTFLGRILGAVAAVAGVAGAGPALANIAPKHGLFNPRADLARQYRWGHLTDARGYDWYWNADTQIVQDAQRRYNYAKTVEAELLGLAPRAPFVAGEQWSDADRSWMRANLNRPQL